MKNKIFSILVALVLVGPIHAQTMVRVEKAIDNYLMALCSKNTGLVESAIINVMKMKTAYPDLDYSSIMKQLEKLTDGSSSRAIRYEAFVVLNYLQYPERFNWIRTDDEVVFEEQLLGLVSKIHTFSEKER